MQTTTFDPIVSIIIPCYNEAKHILPCLHSIENQTMAMEHLDIILADDASTDATMAIIKDFADRYPNSVTALMQKDHAGMGATKNLALSYAQGRYVMFVSGDDLLEKDACERMVALAEKNGLDILQSAYRSIAPDGTESDILGTSMFGAFDLSDVELRKEFLVREIMTLDCTGKLFRRDLLVRARSTFAEGVGYAETKFVYPLLLLAGKVGTSQLVSRTVHAKPAPVTENLWERNLWFMERPKFEIQMLFWLKQRPELFATYKDEILYNFFQRFYFEPIMIAATTDAPITGYDYEWMRLTILGELDGNRDNPYMNGGDLAILISNLNHSFLDNDIALEDYLEKIRLTFAPDDAQR